MGRMRLASCAAARTLVVVLATSNGWACSRALWAGNSKAVIVGPNMDWKNPMPVDLWVLPRGMVRDGLAGLAMRVHGFVRAVQRAALPAAGAAGLWLASATAQEEVSPEVIAVQIRKQGFACQGALSAVRDRKASAPNAAVWVLRCGNTTYRVRLTPDMAAQVERIE
jgi:hypothetical protein